MVVKLRKFNRESLKGQALLAVTVEIGLKDGKPFVSTKYRAVKAAASYSNIAPASGCDIVIDGESTNVFRVYENKADEFLDFAKVAFFHFPTRAGFGWGYCFPENMEEATRAITGALYDALDDKLEEYKALTAKAESLMNYLNDYKPE